MAKKSRRAKRRAKKRTRPVVKPTQPVSAPSPTVAPETASRVEDKAAQLAEEYRYVYSDLKRIDILAGTILAVLIVLSFIIK